MCLGEACGRGRWGLRWSSLWGHETREGCAESDADVCDDDGGYDGDGGGRDDDDDDDGDADKW
eukprot:8880259-Pyramimonas_sp.AAC.1